MAKPYKRQGSKYYYADISVGGKRHRFCTKCKNFRDAEEASKEERARLLRILESEGSISFDRAVDLFFERRKLKKSTIDSYLYNIANLRSHLGDCKLSMITPDDVRAYIDARLDEGGGVVINRELSVLSSIYKIAMVKDKAIKANPVLSVSREGVPKGSKDAGVTLRPDEVEALLEACVWFIHKVWIVLAVDTGMRKGEVLGLRMCEYDGPNRMIHLGTRDRERTKNGDGRVIPLTDRAYAMMEEYIDRHNLRHKNWHSDKPIFVSPQTSRPYTDWKTAWSHICERAGISQVRIHDLRHTFASNGLNAGVPMVTMMALTGHRDVASYKRYAKASLDSRIDAVKNIAEHTLWHKNDTMLKN